MLEVDACNKRKRFHARKQCLGELALNKFQLLRRPLFSPSFFPSFPLCAGIAPKMCELEIE